MSGDNGQGPERPALPPFGALKHLEVELEVNESEVVCRVFVHASGQRIEVVELSAGDAGYEQRVINPPTARTGPHGAWT